MAGEADRELTCVSLTCHSSGPMYVTLVESTLFYGMENYERKWSRLSQVDKVEKIPRRGVSGFLLYCSFFGKNVHAFLLSLKFQDPVDAGDNKTALEGQLISQAVAAVASGPCGRKSADIFASAKKQLAQSTSTSGLATNSVISCLPFL